MRKLAIILASALVLIAVGAPVVVRGDDDPDFSATLQGYRETPAISTTGRGTFEARLVGSTLQYRLRYSDLTGTTMMAHIHFGQKDVAGGVSVWICGGGGRPNCPQSGTVTGAVTAADVVGPANQGIAAGELGELLRAMRAGVTYVNVHSDLYPSGEIRGQIRREG
ncbi:MAG TPA: CHRD domain-containing protein [Methylomirabilota bacterium]|nr:CHRD domain-containing protein [Methylomirabilota bacterium]